MSQLAYLVGQPTINYTFKPWNTLGDQEIAACQRVIHSGVLSGFVGNWTSAFHGGPEVVAFEQEWSSFFGVKHSVSVNSATSGLYAAMGAIGLSPGDEVIVTPQSMSASATAPLIYGALPVFADVNPTTFTLDVASVEKVLTPKTKAILVVNLFGHPAPLHELKAYCQKKSLFLVEDNAQGPGAKCQSKYAGTIGDMGVFSLNCHKHIQTGEGGIVVTNNDELAMRLKLIRNHAEAVVEAKGEKNLVNMVGWNYRMTELEAAVGREQLKKLPKIFEQKRSQAQTLNQKLAKLEALTPPFETSGCESAYYTYALKINPKALKIKKELLCSVLKAEGIPVVSHYVKPLYWAPLFQHKTAFGDKSYPFSLKPDISYAHGLCPVSESLYNEELFYIPWCAYDFSDQDITLIADAFQKVWLNLEEIRQAPQNK